LLHIESIIKTDDVQLDYYICIKGEPVLSIALKKPLGTIYFKTDKESLESFCKGVLSLQHLFEKSDSPIVTIVINEEVKYYMRNDVEIEFPEAEKLIHQIKGKPILKIK
jgi:hypothetical protein